jgi:hypothetical protein
MRILLTTLLMATTFTVQAFNVTVEDSYRKVKATSENSGTAQFDTETIDTYATGAWNESASAYTSGNSAGADQNSNIAASGSYSIYEISYSGDNDYSGWDNNTSSSSISATITFEQGVYYTVSGYCGVGALGSASVGGSALGGDGCTKGGSFSGTGYLEAGTYDLWAGSSIGSGGASSASSGSSLSASYSAVPVPAAVWLFGSGLGLLGWFRGRQSA